MSVFVVAVPALLVVVLGYVAGYELWEAVGGPGDPEVVGWITGLLLLAVVARLLLSRARRLRRAVRRARARGDVAEIARLEEESARRRRRGR